MTDSNTKPTILNLSERIGAIKSQHFDANSNEIFTISLFDEIAIATISGQLLTDQKLPENSTVIGQQRTSSGWQFLNQNDSSLSNHTVSKDNSSVVKLEEPCKSPKSAAWSPCGNYVAVGSIGTTLSVWNIKTGKLIMQNSVNWDNEDEFINPPTLTVTGWSVTGEEIITVTKEMVSSNIVVWDFKTNNVLAIIQ